MCRLSRTNPLINLAVALLISAALCPPLDAKSADQGRTQQETRALQILDKALQERSINITSLLSRHGSYVVDWIYDAIDLGSTEHEIVYL